MRINYAAIRNMSPTYILYRTPYKNDCIQIDMMLRYKIFQCPPMISHYMENMSRNDTNYSPEQARLWHIF